MLRVHRLGSAEAERLRAVRLRALTTDPDAFYSTLEREAAFDAEAWRRRLVDPAVATFVLEDAGDDVGLASCGPSREPEDAGSGAYALTAMWLEARVRGGGASSLLLEAAAHHARAGGARRLLLWVAAGNERALRFYRRHGFEPTGRTGAFPPPRDTPEMEMALELGDG